MDQVQLKNLIVFHNEADARTEYSNSKELVSRAKCPGIAQLHSPGGNGHQLFQDIPVIREKVITMIQEFMIKCATPNGAFTRPGPK